jgi:N-acetylglutamate synthase-like GNAT family acetyltransferase
MPLRPVTPDDVDALRVFLGEVDLTLAGLDAPTVRLWIEQDASGAIVGSTGYELSADGGHALIRSVGVAADRRTAGAGSRLASFALDEAQRAGAGRAWLFSRRSGPFWQKLGFTPADRDELATALPDTHQVRLFVSTGQLQREVAWSRPLQASAS